MVSIRRTGNWRGIGALIDNLEKECKIAVDTSLKRFALKAEGTAKKHLRDQDLNWKPLKPATLAAKLREGYSEKTLIRTSSYFQSITSWVDKTKDVAYIGVKKEVKEPEGRYIHLIARVHEFGSMSGNIPARPLWQPTLEETIEWHKKNNNPATIFLRNIRKYRV